MHSGFRICFVAAMLCSAASPSMAAESKPADTPAQADTKSASKVSDKQKDVLKSLSGLASGLGLKIVQSSDNALQVEDKGNTYVMDVSEDANVVYLWTSWAIEKDKIGKIPFKKMLEWNAGHSTFLGLDDDDSSASNIALYTIVSTETLNLPSLRSRLTALEDDADDADQIADSHNWK